MSFWSNLFSRKVSVVRQALVYPQIGQAVGTPRNFESFSVEGYQKNVIAFRAISGIAKACGGIPWCLYSGTGKAKREIEEHPLLSLLLRPNPMQSQASFFESFVAYFLIAGNTYAHAVAAGKEPSLRDPPRELWTIRPDRVKIIAGVSGMPAAYVIEAQGVKVTITVDQFNGASAMLHTKSFHPTNLWYGMSPIEAAVYAIDQHNQAGLWNFSLLKNSAMPSGAFVITRDEKNPTGTLGEVQFQRTKESIDLMHSGAKNAGRPMVLEGGMDWKQMSLTPKDMDWLNSKNTSARDIALAFGYPSMMLGIPGDNTYSNYKEARLALYEDTIIPIMDHVRDDLNNWLTPMFGKGIALEYDLDAIEAMALRREVKWTQLQTVTYMTVNEKRDAVGLEPYTGAEADMPGSVILVPSAQIPLEDAVAGKAEPTPPAGTELTNPPKPGAAAADPKDPAADPANEGDNATDDAGKSIKLFNNLNAVDRRTTWKQINAKRDYYRTAFQLDMRDELDAQAKAIASNVSRGTIHTAEIAAVKAIDESRKGIEAVLRKHYRRIMLDFGRMVLDSGKAHGGYEVKKADRWTHFVETFIDTHTAKKVSELEGTSVKRVRTIVKNYLKENLETGGTTAELAKRLSSDLEGMSIGRSRTIARTETGMAAQNATLEAARDLEVPNLGKEWVAIDDGGASNGGITRDDPNHADHLSMNGTLISVDDKFTVPPDADMDCPHDPSAPAEQVCNCRCVLVFSPMKGKS